jgi:hypothetical protein
MLVSMIRGAALCDCKYGDSELRSECRPYVCFHIRVSSLLTATTKHKEELKRGLVTVLSFADQSKICGVMESRMSKRVSAALVIGLMFATGAIAKKKDDPVVPDYILRAHTVAVMIDPSAGMAVEDPRANQVAQKDVETALLKWGRFMPVISPKGADIVIVIRKGNKRAVDETVSDPTQNNRPGVINPTDNGVQMGGQRGRQPGELGSGIPDASGRQAQPQMEIGSTDDSFVVHQGDAVDPLDSPVGWRYVAKEGLRSHDVPAVDQFKKALAAAEKAAAAKKP